MNRVTLIEQAEVDAEARALALLLALGMPAVCDFSVLAQRQAAIVSVLMQWYRRGVLEAQR